ncbi:MAG: NHL repeat-containing protein, partial [Nanoarchaeota archaeon]
MRIKQIFVASIVLFLIFAFLLFNFLENKKIDSNANNSEIKNGSLSVKNETTTIISGFVRPFAIAIGQQGAIYVSDFGGHNILIYDKNYKLIKDITPGLDVLNSPHSLDIDSDGNWYVADFLNKKIQKFSDDGKFIKTLISLPTIDGPATAYFDNQGNLLVSDYNSNSLLKFSDDGKFLGWIGAKSDGTITDGWENNWSERVVSNEPGGFDRLHAAKTSSDGTIYVADTWNNRIQKFSDDGKFLGWIGAKSDG